MANTIILKRSATPGKTPTTSQLALGEIAINTYDGRIFIKKDDGTPAVVEIGGVTSVNTQNGDIVLGTDDITEGSSNLYFTTARARASVSAGTGISYSSSTGVIATSQNITTSGTPTFAGLTLTGDMTSRSIIPSASNTYDLGSSANPYRHIYVGPGSLYVNGKQVLTETSGTMTFTADLDQNMRITTTGTGVLQLGSSSTGVNVDGTLQIASGKRITSSDGVKVQMGDDLELNGNKIIGLGTPSANTDAATKGYVDTSISAISTSSITQGNSNVTVADTGTGTVTVTVDGSTALTVDSTGVTVAGNFTVSGTQTVVNSNTINLADNIITLNSDATGTPTQNAGVEVERGDEANVQLRWNEGSTKWTFTNDGAVYHPMATGTDDLTEGSTNLYFTNGRARSAISASSGTGVSYNSSTGAISLGSIPNSSLSNNSITINGSAVALGGSRTLTTDDVADTSATNKYFTNAQARAAVSAGTGISYNSTTGVISTASIPNASLTNSKVTVGTTDISLGGSATTIAGLTSVTSTGFTGALTGNVTGNADTATKLATARAINGVNFDGSAAITVKASTTNALTIGTGLSGTSFDGGSAVTIANTGVLSVNGNAGAITGIANSSDVHYIGTTSVALNRSSANLALTGISSVTLPGSTSGTVQLVPTAAVGTGTVLTIPATTGTIVTTGDSGTVTNTMLAGSIANAKLANSSVTVGTTAISLGASSTTLAGLTSVTSTSFVGALTGNASTVTNGVYTTDTGTVTNTMLAGSIANAKLANSAITINGTSTALGGSISVGTVTSVAAGSYLTGGTITGTGTIAVDATTVNTGGKVVARDLNGDFAARYITASAFVGNASTATTLATARNIQGVSFNGSADITVVTAGTGISVSGTAVTNTLSTSGGSIGGAIAVTGAITATGEITAYYSDANLKKDIVEIQDPISKVMSLRGVTFRPNETALALGITDKEEVGVIAQEVEAVLPQLVTPSAFAGYKTVKYDKLTALLLEAVKAQQLQIDALRAEIAKLGGSATTEL